MFPESLGKIACTTEAAGQCDFRDRLFGLCEKFCRLAETVVRQVGVRRLVDIFSEQAAAFALADVTGFGDLRKGQLFGIMLLDELDHCFRRREVGRGRQISARAFRHMFEQL